MKALRLLPLAALLTLSAPVFAGPVDVTARPVPAHNDAGRTTWDAQSNLDVLGRYLKRLGTEFLRPDQVLKIEILDVDLAGTDIGGGRPRVITGGADWPKIRLRYTLETPGQPVRSGEELVQDMNYTRGLTGVRNDPLHYEKRMLRAWFRERFANV
ncbi:DUF3016 domain-containing protein [Ramlibacter albus]|uniref:DUF3016 domain-containing protein n=1 Tax=Ramlibacter albus TaxID=2079448 RepID=A0A923M9H5_9BURK|nr:DUF3016 domain-containing protein [Ramlibacter albus]MBC5765234.1 DUF3016 domain-containing protein [Ramlibacter albus]